jgi:hypothetical protein
MRSTTRILAAAFAIALVGACLMAVSATQSGGAAEDHRLRDRYEWDHALQVIANLRAAPPQHGVVCLLGGSSGREATVNDQSWTYGLQRQSGTESATAFNLCTSEQTPEESLALVRRLPRMRAVVFIGVSVRRLSRDPSQELPPLRLPEPAQSEPFHQHHYSERDRLARADKLELLRQWTDIGPRHYATWHRTCLAELDHLLAICKRRGYIAVVLFLPANREIVAHDAMAGRALADARSRSRRLATAHGVRFLDVNEAAHLGDGDFRDLWHLLRQGREKCQKVLADEASRLLRSDPR